jgi:hypothetical protein
VTNQVADNGRAKSRRAILAAAVGGAAAVAAQAALPLAAQAHDPDDVQKEAVNVTADTTTIDSSATADVDTFAAKAGGTGTAIAATADDGHGVDSQSAGAIGVQGANTDTTPTSDWTVGSNKTGVLGTAGDNSNIANNTDETGVYGFADLSGNSTGVWGDSFDGIGTAGTGDVGVFGGGGSIGVYATNFGITGAYALWTNGRVKFEGRSGRGVVLSGHNYRDVSISGMTSTNAVIATLMTYKSGYYIAAAVASSGKVRVYLNKTATSNMVFSYFVLG